MSPTIPNSGGYANRARHPVLRACRPVAVAAILALAAVLLAADQPPERGSGLQVGEKVSTFYVRAITGPHRNKSVCYVCRNGDRPVVMVFVREIVPELSKLLKGIDREIDAHRAQGLRGFGVFFARDSKELLPAIQTLAFDEQLDLPLTVAAAAVEGRAGQNIREEACVTLVCYRDLTVTANYSWRADELTSAEVDRALATVRDLATAP